MKLKVAALGAIAALTLSACSGAAEPTSSPSTSSGGGTTPASSPAAESAERSAATWDEMRWSRMTKFMN